MPTASTTIASPITRLPHAKPIIRLSWDAFASQGASTSQSGGRLTCQLGDIREARQAHLAFTTHSLDAPLSASDDPGLIAAAKMAGFVVMPTTE